MADEFFGSRIGETLEDSNKRFEAEKFGSESNTPSSEAKNTTDGSAMCVPIKDNTQITSKKRSSNLKISCGNIDKRVALTVAPKTSARDETLFVNKVKYVLGPKFYDKSNVKWLTTSKFYGLLRNALGSTSGLIFPYTPNISFNHSVNYETTDIMHSNLSYNSYKNTPTPTISISAKFTADNRDNALHMLSAIWFCIACSKCDFGEKSSTPGLPPPILYLSGYDHLIDNIPVVISSVGYKYPDDLHYVNLVLDMSKDYNNDKSFCRIYDTVNTYDTTKEHFPQGYISYTDKTGEVIEMWDDINDDHTKTTSVETSKTGINMSYWLPTELQLELQLKIQPNLFKTKKQWSLDGYKTSLLMTNNSKNPPIPISAKETEKNNIGIMYSTFNEPVGYCPISTKEEVTETKDSIPSGWTW